MNIKKRNKLLERKKNLKARVEKLKEQKNKKNSLYSLLEGHLEQAESILTARDTVNKLQNMAEDLAKIQVETMMPLVDDIKSSFNSEMAEKFEKAVEDDVGNALEAVRNARESANNAVLRLEGKLSDNDEESDLENDSFGGDDKDNDLDFDLTDDDDDGSDDDNDDDDEFNDDDNSDDEFNDDDNSDDEDSKNPIGRKRKDESRNTSLKNLSEGEKVKIKEGLHKGKIGKLKTKDLNGPNSIVIIEGKKAYIKNNYIRKLNERGSEWTGWKVSLRRGNNGKIFPTQVKARTESEAYKKARQKVKQINNLDDNVTLKHYSAEEMINETNNSNDSVLYEIEMDGKTYYTRARNKGEAAEKVKKKFGKHFSRASATGKTKEKGKDHVEDNKDGSK